MHISALLIPIAALAAHALAQFDPHPSEPIGTPAQATLIARESALVPGTIAHLGVRFSIVEHWHIYWDGQNDSGLPPMIRLDLPDGFEALPTQWPAPRRHILGANDLLDHVLEGDVLAIIPVRVPASAAPGSIVSISGHADWLVCDEACVPGNADLTISLPVVPGTDKARPSSEASIFERALVTIPVSMPTDPSTMGVEVSWNDRTLILHVPGATHLEFSPHASGGTLLDRFSDAVTRATRSIWLWIPATGSAACCGSRVPQTTADPACWRSIIRWARSAIAIRIRRSGSVRGSNRWMG